MSDTTERALLIQYAEGIVHAAIYGPEMGWTHPEEMEQGRREAIETVRALAAELAAAEKRNAELVDVLGKAERAIVDAQNIICPDDRQRWIGSGIILDEVRAALAAASEGKP